MKVGTHAREDLGDIIKRKRREIEEAGLRPVWGLRGKHLSSLLTIVQPFARDFVQQDGVIYLCMHPMTSNHFAPPERASEYSADRRLRWRTCSEGHQRAGLCHALAYRRQHSWQRRSSISPSAHTEVAIGNSTWGRRGDRYITGRVDKGPPPGWSANPEVNHEDDESYPQSPHWSRCPTYRALRCAPPMGSTYAR